MLTNKVAIVTGGSRGIGKAISLELGSKGATVIVNYNGSKDAAEAVVNTITENGGKAVAYPCNVSDFNSVKEFIENIVKEYGQIDILVNNAGITKDNLLLKMSDSDFDDVINVNLKGAFNCLKHASRYMLKQRSGKIINLTSVIGIVGNMGQANYAASKAGVIGLTKSAAKELASRGITVNAVAPGFIKTEMTDVLNEKIKEATLEKIPLNRFGEAEEIAKLVSFLASDDANYITGQVIQVDGGMV
ncbi:3-oxoacyl-[acyl-carrier-protein] reductase [Natranaerovirga pectinivora]|uniref:3-oxoacyl-[acyl-carrier-protein] reductase n=1 Tax=Natranaerovirga pectinivora TaxID=682400 RepID=A0A4R3MFG8_9FIRM|nr:3-oxoacyl-[acyl-carrier-protein] reductase [Natranaerovirga pectinivora]TCT12293.1 3-oxoacyl-[acyl-carrier-protein] reductase [Natranaerovirga pectinivora]